MRVVSLLPSATEILYAVGAGDSVVGVTHECDYPEDARRKPRVTASALPHAGSSAEIDRHVRKSVHAGSSLYTLDSELLATLAPDLIITQELCAVCAVSYGVVTTAMRRLRSDPRIVSLEPSSLADVNSNIISVGELVGAAPAAREVVERLRKRERKMHALVADCNRPRTLVLEWTDPPFSGGHWTPGLVELAGGAPVLAHPGENSQRLSWEDIAAADPDAVLVAPCGFDLEATARAAAELAAEPVWRSLRAVREGKVALVDGSAYVNRPGPRLTESAEIFACAIHPELADRLDAHPSGWRWMQM